MTEAITTKIEQVPAVQVSESASLLSVIERMAVNPEIDPDRIERFIALKERMEAKEAEKLYFSALSDMQADLPIVQERGRIEVRKKDAKGDRTGEVQQSTSYALWEDINEAIKPHLKTHGFALSFRTGQSEDGRVTVTAILSHRAGHKEDTTMILQHDSTGSKNSVQAIGSSTSYGKRYTASALLNLTSRGEDNDGGEPDEVDDLINIEQRDEILKGLAETESDIELFCKHLKVASVPEIKASQYARAVAAIETKRRKV